MTGGPEGPLHLAAVRAVLREAEALVAFVEGIGLSATLEPARLPAARQPALVDGYLTRLR